MTPSSAAPQFVAPGTRVRLTQDFEIFPVGIIPKGEVGTVVDGGNEHVFGVHLDTYFECLEEWQNDILITVEMGEDGQSFEQVVRNHVEVLP